jgi:PAS domain S-box-containing protein
MSMMAPKSLARARRDDDDAAGEGGAVGFYFPLLFERSPIPMFIYDWDDLHIVLVNDAALTQYGYSRAAFLGLRVTDLMMTKEAAQAAEDRASIVLRAGQRLHRKADGTTFFVDILRHRLALDGKTLALVACPDASARVQAEEKTRRSHENLARAQRISSTGSVERDFLTQRTQWSEQTYRIFGVDPARFTPSPATMLALVHPEDRARVREALEKAAKGIPVQVRYRVVRPDGTVRVVYREAEVIADDEGQPLRSVSTIRDVTDEHEAQERQRKLEAELRVAKDEAEALARAVQDANADLERRVEERTVELRAAHAELLRRERLAALGQLTATVAHELRNPLSAIKNTAFIIGETTATRGVALDRPLQRIQRSIDRCDRIISDLLDFSRTREPDRRLQNFDHWLREAMEELSAPDGVTVALELRAGATEIRFDGERFRQVVINLFDNAVQAMAEAAGSGRSPRLTVRTRALEPVFEIVFEDNGPGIAPDVLARAFEPLFSTKNFGTGLGLATVKHIVEQHHGSIEIASALGEGTRVVMRLPLEAEDPARG